MTNIIILVHGTWGKSENAWYQASSHENSFRFRLEKELKNNELKGRVLVSPFEWSGENNHKERILAAEKLSDQLVDHFHTNLDPVFHFIAHSHGGNVALKAIEMYLVKLKNSMTEEIVFPNDIPIDTFNNGIKLDKTFELITYNRYVKNNKGYHKNIIEQTHWFIEKLNIKSNLLIVDKDPELKELLLKLENARKLYQEWTEINDREILDDLTEAFNLEDDFSKTIDRLLTYREFNKIYSISTLGTPFYFKSWNPKKSKILDSLISIVLVPLIFVMLYILFASLHDNHGEYTQPYNIMNWHWSIIILYFYSSIMMARYYFKNPSTRSPSDTNIYFDLTKLHSLIKNLGDRKISKILVIHANHLDEAYLGLSSLPIVGSIAGNKFKDIYKPKLWNFKKPHKVIGVLETSLQQKIRYYSSYSTALIKSILGIFTYPIYLILFNPVRNWFITHKLFSTIRALLIGLPESEFSESNINIRNNPGEFPNNHEDMSSQNQDINKYFKIVPINVDDHIKVIKINNDIESDRYSFLRKKGVELEPYIKRSMIVKEQKIDFSKMTDEEIWNILSLEERGKEFFGIAGLRHSMYYEQKKIVAMIAQHIINESNITH